MPTVHVRTTYSSCVSSPRVLSLNLSKTSSLRHLFFLFKNFNFLSISSTYAVGLDGIIGHTLWSFLECLMMMLGTTVKNLQGIYLLSLPEATKDFMNNLSVQNASKTTYMLIGYSDCAILC